VSFYKLGEKNSDNFKDKTSSLEERFDITGMFHWTEKKSFEECLLSTNQKYDFANHVIVCVYSNENSPLIGLRNFVLPLRASNFHKDELKKIIFVGNDEFLKKEWETINNFPNVYIMPGTPNSRSCLRALNIQLCNMCVIISSIDRVSTDEHLIDKSAILCSLNIKAMNFEDKNNEIIFGRDVPMLTELRVDSNVQFLDQEDEDDPNKELYMSQPFACGASFANSVLDCMIIFYISHYNLIKVYLRLN
jgi:potassium large conductance calcium-activated channel subfamily M alpha member 1